MTVGLILNPQRAARLVEHHASDATQPGLDDVVDRLTSATWKAAPAAGLTGQVQRAIDNVVLHGLMELAADDEAPAQVRATASAKLNSLREWLLHAAPAEQSLAAFHQYAAAEIKRFADAPTKFVVPRPPAPPPGMPIGDDERGYTIW